MSSYGGNIAGSEFHASGRTSDGIRSSIRQGYPAPIAYTYDAAEHCPGCAAERFGVDDEGWIPEDACDSEGNPIGAVAPWDEGPDRDMACDTCGGLIREYVEDDDAGDDVQESLPSLPDFPGSAGEACRRARDAWSRTAQQLALDL